MLSRALVTWLLIFLALTTGAEAQRLHGAGATSVGACDSICQLAETMTVGEALNVVTQTSFTNVSTSLGTTKYNCANYDGSKVISGGSPNYCGGTGVSVFNGDAGVQAELNANSPDNYLGFSGGVCGYGSAGVWCMFLGGGHWDTSGNADGTIWGVNMETAALNKKNSAIAPNWQAIYPSGRAVWGTVSTVRPSWSSEGLDAGCAAAGFYTTTAQDTGNTGSVSFAGLLAGHTAFAQLFAGANGSGHPIFLMGSAYVTANFCSTGPGTASDAMIVDPIAGTATLAQSSPGVGGGPFWVPSSDGLQGGNCYDPSSGNVFGATNDGRFFEWTTPQTGSNRTQLFPSGGIYTDGIAAEPDFCAPDPQSAGQVMYVAIGQLAGGTNNIGLNITGTPVFGGSGNLAAITPTLTAGAYYGWAYDSDDGYGMLADGSGHIYPLNFHGSHTVINWSIDNDPTTLSGDVACQELFDNESGAPNKSLYFTHVTYLPKNRPGGGGLGVVILFSNLQICLKRWS